MLLCQLGAADEKTHVTFKVYPPDAEVYVERLNENGYDFLGDASSPISLSREEHFKGDMGTFVFRAPGREDSDPKQIAWTQVKGDKTFDTQASLVPLTLGQKFHDLRTQTAWGNTLIVGVFLLAGGLVFGGVKLAKAARVRKEEEERLERLREAGVSEDQRFGRYFLKSRIGKGGGGEVYRALPVDNPSKEAAVALKRLDSNFGRDNEFCDRFKREIATTSRLVHPNVIKIHESGEVDGNLFFVMELLEGIPVETLAQNQPGKVLAPELAGKVISQAAAGLHHAHQKGLVHRDVKGDNLFYTKDERVIVIDFGCARKPKETIQITQDSQLPGTRLYMPPESASVHSTEDEAKYFNQSYDQFSLATLAFELLTARRPFQPSANAALFMESIHFEEIYSVQKFQPQLSKEFDAVFERALSKEPERRYPTILAFAEEFARVCRQQNEADEKEGQ